MPGNPAAWRKPHTPESLKKKKETLTTAELQTPLLTERGGTSLKTQVCVEEK